MARPIVLVFQEIANASVVPIVPDLNTIIVGPAYVVNDYPDDSANILLTDTYGLLDQPAKTAGLAVAYVPPASGVTTIDVVSYPNNQPGAVVDHDSVKLYLKSPRVILGSTYLLSGVAPLLGAAVTTSSATPDDLNKITFSVLVDLPANGISSGDIIILTDSTGVTVKRTVLSVSEGGASLNVLRVTQNLPTTGWTFDASGGARIERTLATQLVLDPTGVFLIFPEPSENELLIKGGIKLPVTIASVEVQRTVSYAECYLAYRALRQDLQHVDSCDFTQIETKVGKIDARNPLAVGLSVALQNSGSAIILFYGVASNDIEGHARFRDAVSSRKDLYALVPLTNDRSILLSYKIDNVTLADPLIASDTGVVQKFRQLLGSGILPTEETISVGTTQGTPQQTGASSGGKFRTIHIKAPALADITAAIPGDTVTIGVVPVAAGWAGRRGTHYVSHVNEPTPGDKTYFELLPTNTAWSDGSGNDSGVVPATDGVEIRLVDQNGVTLYEKLAEFDFVFGASTLTIAHRNPVTSGGPYTVQFVAGLVTAATLSGFNITVTYAPAATVNNAITAIAAAVDVIAAVTTSLTGPGTDVLTPVATQALLVDASLSGLEIILNDNYFDILQDNTATFLTDGVLPGDIIEIPADPNDYSNDAFLGAFSSFVIDIVVSENRLRLVPVSDDTPTVATEFPHAYSRSGSGLIDVSTPTAIRYRVQRQLTKDAQVTALTAVAQSFLSSRATLMWPDEVKVSGLVDGSLPRSSPLVSQSAANQPGYYIACAVGGAMAGLPAQQGLTNLSFAGLDSVTHATDYFTDQQITKISDGGWFVLQQDNQASAPYCIHQLTTDITAVETGELSVVKTFDFDSLFLMGILETFIGRYNVTEDALTEINRSLVQGFENLKIRKVARIGAPLISGKVISVSASTISSDRVEVYCDLQIPRPLNRIGLHLII